MKNRIISSFLSFLMLFSIFSICITPVKADSNTITIKTKEDFARLANNCTMDSWSHGKTINLTSDIDFTGSAFSPIPTFSGTFNGNGYTLSGISYDEKGSYKGVFRYIEQGGKISDLNVEAKFLLNGSKSFLGGIAGENSGIIENCSFEGYLKGENVIGGIVGNNTDYGRIISCVSSGVVIGENSTGGIAGKSSGFIQNCTNNSSVNTTYEEKKTDIANIDTDTAAIIENYKNFEEENGEESVLGHTDSGGIVGVTSGIIQGCTNNGAIGYKHIGYNIGGIAGRQSGFVLGCQNYGFIQGRKDVGGIVGQAEPYILLHASESTLQELKEELNNLNSMINNFISDTDNIGDETKNHLDGISKYAKDAQKNAQTLINQGTNFVDDNLAEINAQAAILSDTFDKLVPVFDNLETSGEDISKAMDLLSQTLDDLNLYSPNLQNDIDDISSALSYISKSERDLKKAVSRAKKAINNLDDAICFNNSTKVQKAVSELVLAINDIISAKLTIRNSINQIENILTDRPENFESAGLNVQKILENLKLIKDKMEIVIASLKTVNDSIGIIVTNTEIYFSEFKSAARNIQASISYLSNAMHYITQGLSDLGDAVSSFSVNLEDYVLDVGDELSETKKNLSDAFDSLSYAASDIKNSISEMGDIVKELADEKPLEFVKLGNEFKSANDELFNSLSGISKEIDGLKNAVSNKKDNITSDLSSINNQFSVVMNLLIGEVEELKNGADSLAEIFVDVSDEDIDSARQGKIENCKNSGTVEADRNTGGITGNMAIEYSKDPEDDIEKPTTLNFTYRTKAVLQSCINDGIITGKKDCVGGVAGKAEIGTIYECENYGDTQSTSGNYTGGIVGKSDSSVRKCYAKNKLSGKRYIGGIAGKANTISSCYTIVNISGDETFGAICGNADKNNLYNNFYINNGIGALDGISFKGKCETISFNELKNISDIPSRFISFTVTFVADDKIVETQSIKYGDETKRIKFPETPTKKGYFGKWQEIKNEIVTENISVTCDYHPYITILSSSEKNENNKLALALAEGEFTDSAELHVIESKETPPVKQAENVKVYDISMINTNLEEKSSVTIRLLNENKDKVTAWQLCDGKWQKIKTSNKGKYIITQLDGTQNTICLKYDKKVFNVTWIILLTAILIGSILIFLVRKKRKK